jgi:chromosomal replication initiation ATPase DnaA
MENAHREIGKIEETIVKLNGIIQELYSLLPFENRKDVKPEYLLHYDYLIDGICDYYGITRHELQTYRRQKTLVTRRKLASRILYMYSDRTLDQVAALVGYKNHATVLHHIKKSEEELSTDYYGNDDIKKTYSQLLNHLKLNNHDKEATQSNGH